MQPCMKCTWPPCCQCVFYMCLHLKFHSVLINFFKWKSQGKHVIEWTLESWSQTWTDSMWTKIFRLCDWALRIFGKYRYISKRKSAGRCRLKSNRSECNKVRCNFQPRSVNALFLWLPQLRYSANFNVVYKWWYYLICNVYPVKQLLRRISAQSRVLHTLCLSRARDLIFFHQCRVSPLEKLTSSWKKTDLFPVILFVFSLIIICRWISLSYYMKLEIISLSLNSGL